MARMHASSSSGCVRVCLGDVSVMTFSFSYSASSDKLTGCGILTAVSVIALSFSGFSLAIWVRSVLDELLNGFKENLTKDITATVTATQTTLDTKITERITNLMREFDSATQRRMSDIEGRVIEVSGRMDDQVKAMQDMKKDIEKLKKGLVEAEVQQPTRASLNEENYDREPDVTILRVGAAELISKEAAVRAVKPWLDEADSDATQYEIIGPTLGRNFTVKFAGTGGLAAKRARRAFAMLRGVDGTWREMVAKSPLNKDIKIYVSEDKSMKTIKTETSAKRLMRAFKAVHPEKEVHLVRRTGTISVAWVPIARVDAANPDDIRVMWNAAAVGEHSVNKNDIVMKFGTDAGASAQVNWTL